MLGYKEPRACWHRQEELYSWYATYICIVDSFSGLSRILSELSCFGKKVFALNREVLGSRKNVLPEFIQVVVVLSGTEVMYFSHSSLNPEISQFIALKLNYLALKRHLSTSSSPPYIPRHQLADLSLRPQL